MTPASSIAVLVALAAGGLAGAACTGQTRSDEFVCAGPADCAGGRRCVDGFCVAGTGPADAGAGAIDARDNGRVDASVDAAPPCPGVCDRCDGDTCFLTPGLGGPDPVCPRGWACDVTCGGGATCDRPIDCAQATRCDIHCLGGGSCGGEITCGTGPCVVTCSGGGSCGGGVACGDACACDVTCVGSCAPAAQCPRDVCRTQGGGCSSAGPSVCDRCP
ncbi:MAG: hypothetical protein KBG28_21835 [Kofleriaceae bacterium]|jgi:hypothetical protein|nr:hypothetical protein [Kofleriaceae bacterium]